ncbi:MAG: HEPN domain-containing protein [Bacteroidota bacterium]
MKPLETLNDEYKSIVSFLNQNSQPSLSSDVNKNFKKIIVLSSASYYEHLIQEILVEFITKETNNNTKVVNFVKKKAIGMQYHTYFTWGEKDNPDKPGKNANTFFSLFGDDFKKNVDAEIKTSPHLEVAVKAFLEIGHLRNILVHSNFAAYDLNNKTADEIFDLYKAGLPFIEYIKNKLQTK